MSNGQVNDQRDCSPDSSQQQSLMGQRQEVEGVETKLRGKIWTGDAVVLRLRGGGSSRLRKQARERKFDQLGFKNHDSGQLSASELKEGKTMRPLESLHLEEVLSKPKSGDTLTMAPGLRETSEKTTEVEASAQKSAFKKASRFIVFIGNLPFTATNDSIKKHFTKVKPSSIRHSTIKDTGKSKGFAFIEFEDYDRMQTCLKLYHHSSFEDGESPPRKLNVELTAGGGGHSRARKLKLRTKNEKLQGERQRMAEKQESFPTKAD
ncbi:hypothetical protein MMC31_001168 [Peltigera leucophlebia]|nr:hypothetical protein [Peltigera leucophlebia]